MTTQRTQRLCVLLAFAAGYAIMVFFTWAAPFAADDLPYGYNASFSLKWIIEDTRLEYFDWNGRSVALFIGRCLLAAPPAFNVLLTPLVFMGLIFFSLMLIHGQAWRKRLQWWQPVLFFGMLWFMVPAFGTVFFWVTGAACYLWTLFFVLCFLVPLRLLYDDARYTPPLWLRLIYPLLGVCAGWSHEIITCIGPATGMLAVGLTLWRRRRVPLWLVCGLLGVICGSVLLLTAPGNMARYSLNTFAAFRAMTFGQKLMPFLNNYLAVQCTMLPLYLLCLLSWQRMRRMHTLLAPGERWIGLLLFLYSQGTLCILFFSPFVTPRVFTATFVFCILLTVFFITRAVSAWQTSHTIILGVFVVVLAVSMAQQAYVFAQNKTIDMERARLLASGAKVVELPPYVYPNKYFFIGHEVEDVSRDTTHWVNEEHKLAYALDSVFIRKTPCQRLLRRGYADMDGERATYTICANGTVEMRLPKPSTVSSSAVRIAFVSDSLEAINLFRRVEYALLDAVPDELRSSAEVGRYFTLARCQYDTQVLDADVWVCQVPTSALKKDIFVGIQDGTRFHYKRINAP